MLVWKSSVTAKAIPAAAIIIVVGGDAVVGHALELLLRGSGYDARFEGLSTFAADGKTLDTGLILLAPGLDERGRETVLTSVDVARRGVGLPVVELVPATASRPGEGHAILPWPCRTEDLEREVEAALHGTGATSAGDSLPQREGESLMIKVTIRVGKGEAGVVEAISAPSIREAVVIAQARYPEEEIRVSYPIDGEAFFPSPHLREAAARL